MKTSVLLAVILTLAFGAGTEAMPAMPALDKQSLMSMLQQAPPVAEAACYIKDIASGKAIVDKICSCGGSTVKCDVGPFKVGEKEVTFCNKKPNQPLEDLLVMKYACDSSEATCGEGTSCNIGPILYNNKQYYLCVYQTGLVPPVAASDICQPALNQPAWAWEPSGRSGYVPKGWEHDMMAHTDHKSSGLSGLGGGIPLNHGHGFGEPGESGGSRMSGGIGGSGRFGGSDGFGSPGGFDVSGGFGDFGGFGGNGGSGRPKGSGGSVKSGGSGGFGDFGGFGGNGGSGRSKGSGGSVKYGGSGGFGDFGGFGGNGGSGPSKGSGGSVKSGGFGGYGGFDVGSIVQPPTKPKDAESHGTWRSRMRVRVNGKTATSATGRQW